MNLARPCNKQEETSGLNHARTGALDRAHTIDMRLALKAYGKKKHASMVNPVPSAFCTQPSLVQVGLHVAVVDDLTLLVRVRSATCRSSKAQHDLRTPLFQAPCMTPQGVHYVEVLRWRRCQEWISSSALRGLKIKCVLPVLIWTIQRLEWVSQSQVCISTSQKNTAVSSMSLRSFAKAL